MTAICEQGDEFLGSVTNWTTLSWSRTCTFRHEFVS